MISQRLSRRIQKHHIPIAFLSIAAAALLYFTRSYPDVITRLSFATAYPALALLGITLIIGRWRTVWKLPIQSSMDVRRDIGIWQASLASFMPS